MYTYIDIKNILVLNHLTIWFVHILLAYLGKYTHMESKNHNLINIFFTYLFTKY